MFRFLLLTGSQITQTFAGQQPQEQGMSFHVRLNCKVKLYTYNISRGTWMFRFEMKCFDKRCAYYCAYYVPIIIAIFVPIIAP